MFARKTVDGVLAAFHKAVAELTVVETEQMAEADRQNEIALEAHQLAADAESEADRARRIRERMSEVLR